MAIIIMATTDFLAPRLCVILTLAHCYTIVSAGVATHIRPAGTIDVMATAETFASCPVVAMALTNFFTIGISECFGSEIERLCLSGERAHDGES